MDLLLYEVWTVIPTRRGICPKPTVRIEVMLPRLICQIQMILFRTRARTLLPFKLPWIHYYHMTNYGMFKRRGELFMMGGERDRSRFYRPTNTMLEVWVCLTRARRNELP